MKIDNVDALKEWLVNVLNPIFDGGDPDKLASYIVALAKKVENDQASRDRCITDLAVFLEGNTNSFVETLFDTLVTKKYLNSSSNTTSNTNNNNTETDRKKDYYESSSSSRHQTDRERDRSRRFNSNYDDPRRNNNNNQRDFYHRGGGNRSRLSRDYQEIETNKNRSRSRSSKTRHKNRNRNHRSSSSSSSSSSPSINASSSRRFDGERKNAYKRSYSRSRSYSPKNRLTSNDDPHQQQLNKKQRCKDFDEKGFCTQAELCPFDHGDVVIAPLMTPNTTNEQQQQQQDLNTMSSNSNNFNSMYSNQNDMYNNNNNNQMPRHQRNNNNNNQRRNQQKSSNGGLLPMPSSFPVAQQQQQGRFQSNQRNTSQIGNNNFNNNNNNNNLQTPQTNMNMGANPQQVQQNDLFNAQQRPQLNSNRPRNLVNIPTSIHQDDQSNNESMLNQGNFNNNNQQRGVKRGYYNNFNNNNNLNQGFGVNNSDYQSNLNQQQQQPALLPTPVPLQQQSNQMQPIQNKTSIFNNNQTNISGQSQNMNTTLVLRKVPTEMNKVDKMRQHFSKFGQIVDIICQYESNNDATYIQFATNQQAFSAFKCPQSVFNNRFIRIYWLSNYQKQQNQQQHQQQQQQQQQNNNFNTDEPSVKRHVKERLGYSNNTMDSNEQSHPDTLNEAKNKENKDIKMEDMKQEQAENKDLEPASTTTTVNTNTNTGQNLTNNFSTLNINKSFDSNNKKINYENAAKVIQDENQKKVLLLKMEVKQKARELIEKQIKDQKLLLTKFENAKTVEEKTQILELVKKLSQSIEKEREILNNKSFETPSSPSLLFSTGSSPFTFQKVPTQKNIIIPPPVHSLKLNNKRLNNTNFLKSQANQLMKASGTTATQAAVASTPPAPPNPKPTYLGTSLPAQFSYSKVDNRPRQLTFSGFENSQEKNALINFINMIGCQIETVTDSNSESTEPMAINFATRKDAEIALSKCSASLNGKPISITWSKQQETLESKLKEQADQQEPSSSNKLENKINTLLSTDEYDDDEDDDSKSKEKPLDTNESTNESTEQETTEQKEFVDALFDDSTNYEQLLS